jgi:hypothetical protein
MADAEQYPLLTAHSTSGSRSDYRCCDVIFHVVACLAFNRKAGRVTGGEELNLG